MIQDADEQYFKFQQQSRAIIFVDGNFMINISRALSLKLDMEKLFENLSKGFFRIRTYWYSSLENKIDRTNNAYRFLDRLRYIPRTKVYTGHFSKRQHSHFDAAIRTDAGIALAINLVEQALHKNAEYFILITTDPEYIPAIRAVQRNGGIVRLYYPQTSSDRDLKPHPELIKAVDEHIAMDAEFLHGFEYKQYYDDEDNEDYHDDLVVDDDMIDLPDELIEDEIDEDNSSSDLKEVIE